MRSPRSRRPFSCPTRTRTLTVEQLESRALLAADLATYLDFQQTGDSESSDGIALLARTPRPFPQRDYYPSDDGALRYDASGLAYYQDPIDELMESMELSGSVPKADEKQTLLPPSQPGTSSLPPATLVVPVYHSNPAFTKKIYLDFDGHIVTGTSWNNQNYTGSYNTGATITAPPFSTDADLANYSASELVAIQETWARVSEDFAPFQVDVTTEDPGAAIFLQGGQAIRVLISTDVDAVSGTQWFPNAGGVAYLNSFNFTNGSPVWVFSNRLGNGFPKYLAEATSHEVGHAFDLSHDGRSSPSEGYYQGHGSGPTAWAPIMGVGYYRPLSQWSKGEYTSANSTEDDISIIGESVPEVVDDHGNASGAATLLNVGTTGSVASSGIISTRTDVDAFRFATQTGSITINVEPFDYATGKANLDVQATLLNALGATVATINGPDILNAVVTATVPKGFYTLLIDGVGRAASSGDQGYSDYGSLGRFTLTGTVLPNHPPVAAADAISTGTNISKLIDVLANDSDPDSDTLTLQSVGAPSSGTATIESGKIRYVPALNFTGQATFTYTIVDELGTTASGTVTVNVVDNVPPVLTVNAPAVVGSEGSTAINLGTWSDVDSPASSISLSASSGTIVKNNDGTWSWSIGAGDQVAATNVTITADDGLGGIATLNFTYSFNNLAPTLTILNSSLSGNVLATFANSGTYSDVPADTVSLTSDIGTVVRNNDGTWTWSYVPSTAIANQTVTITASDEDGGIGIVTFTITAVVNVATRGLFYNNATGSDAISSLGYDKSALLPGQTSTYANYTNYSRGLNGVVIDIAGLPSTTDSTVMATNLQLSTWNGIDVAGFLALPGTIVPTITLQSGAGALGSTRVRITFADNAISNTWLRVTVLASAGSGLTSPDVFYFGNVIGEVNTGNTSTRYRVNSQDISLVRNNQSTGNDSVNVTSPYDLNRDGRVNSQDTSIVRNNQQTSGIVAPITAPSNSPPGPSFTPGGKNGSGAAPPVKSSGENTGGTGTLTNASVGSNSPGEAIEEQASFSNVSFPITSAIVATDPSNAARSRTEERNDIGELAVEVLESAELGLDQYFTKLGLQNVRKNS